MSDYPKEEIDYMFERLGAVEDRLKRLEAQLAEPGKHPLTADQRLAVLVNQVRSLSKLCATHKSVDLVEMSQALLDIAVKAES